MTTPDPADVAAEAVRHSYTYGHEWKPAHMQGIAETIRTAYAPHMKAAEEMVKAFKEANDWCVHSLDGFGLGEGDKLNLENDMRNWNEALARWRELNPEVEG